jgi:hypothetical protein
MIDLLIKLLLPIYVFLALGNPSKAFLLWVLLSPISNTPLFELGPLGVGPWVPSLTFDRIAIGALLVSLILRGELKRPISSGFNRLERWMIVFISVLTVELLFTYRPKDATRMFLTIFDFFVIPFWGYYFAKILMVEKWTFNKKFFNNFLAIAVVCGFYLALMGIYEGLTLIDLLPGPINEYTIAHGGGLRARTGLPRVNGPFINPETFGVVLSMIFFILVYKARINSHLSQGNNIFDKIKYSVVTITILIGIWFNMFRSIWLGLFFGLVWQFILIREVRSKWIFIAMLVSPIMIIILANIGSSNIYENRIGVTSTFYDRLGAYLYCLRAFAQNPIIGIGFGRLPKYIEHAFESGDIIYVEGSRAASYAHNTFLSLLAENGIIGLVPYIFILYSIVKIIKSNYSHSLNYFEKNWIVTVVSIFLAYLVPLFFDKTGYYPKVNNLFFIIIGMMVGSMQRNLTKLHNKSSGN